MVSNEQLHESFSELMIALYRASSLSMMGKPGISLGLVPAAISVLPNDRALAAKLRAPKGSLDGTAMPLKAPNSGLEKCLILLWADWDFTEERSRAKIEVGFFRSKTDANYFRFEHGTQNGRHRYWHSQFSRNFSQLTSPPSKATIDPSVPAFPLACNDSAGLLVACAVSIYGTELDQNLKTKINSVALTDDYLRKLLAQR
jgi:hypothetical protein